MIHTELVGRQRDVAALHQWLGEAIDGRPRLVFCLGEPGIGKTRLAQELAALAAEKGLAAVWGRAVETEGAPP